jgi:hypothetical protein
MNRNHRSGVWFVLGCAVAAAFSNGASAVEVTDLKGFEQLFGRYAPAGDCKRKPQFVVDVSGFTFEVVGKNEKVTDPEYAASYGAVTIDPQDQDYPDGPRASPRNAALIKGSPYAKCK